MKEMLTDSMYFGVAISLTAYALGLFFEEKIELGISKSAFDFYYHCDQCSYAIGCGL